MTKTIHTTTAPKDGTREQLFKANVSLFATPDFRSFILENPDYRNIVLTNHFSTGMWGAGSAHITLGEWLQACEHEEFKSVCPHCKQKFISGRLVFFGGSPLSGAVFEQEFICTYCSKEFRKTKQNLFGSLFRPQKDTQSSFGALWKIIRQYRTEEAVIDSEEKLRELIEILKEKMRRKYE
ncbi:MAG: hypothetical protein LBR51_04440 [Bacteroidales bacterium]|jgi:hypothetical protein|nr:hypothetical protein [Bacteroidales bacterium]